jgi:hypothetical protein
MRRTVTLKVEATFSQNLLLIPLRHAPVFNRKYTKVITSNTKNKKKNFGKEMQRRRQKS